MRYLLLLLVVFSTVLVHGQNKIPENFTGSFINKSTKVSWEKTFTASTSIKDVAKKMMGSSLFSDVDLDENIIYAKVQPFKLDYKIQGGNGVNTLAYITDFIYSGFIIIKKTDAGFTTTLKNIKARSPKSYKVIDARLDGFEYPLETFVINKKTNEFDTKSFVGRPAYVLDYNFNVILKSIL
ncbi:MAG: hypothetical protein ACK5NK_01835 [Niabella sp.]